MAFIGEAALSALFEALFGKISSLGFEFVTEKRVRKEIKSWETMLKTIHGVLADAEEKQMKNEAIKIWVADLRDLAYDVDDILDEFATQALGRRKRMEEEHRAIRTTWYCTSLRPTSIMFNYKTMSKMKEITSRLDGLSKRRTDLHLRESNDVGRPTLAAGRPPSTSLVNEGTVRGRDNDKKAILDLVLMKDEGVSVIPIIGMGGIGKTTLAQLVYNDDTINRHFDLKAWVCVSEQFDIFKITKTILQSVTSESCDSKDDLNSLQVTLKEKLSNKKFFLVLDDVWNENYNHWMALRPPFDAGAAGSKIVVTTRSSNVSAFMRTIEDYSLQVLSDDDSLSMLAHHAFERGDFSEHPELKEMGLEIVNKCGGLPLATKTIGGLLRTRVNRDAWKDILESEIWNLPEKKSDIIPALWLSYYYLPSQLKQCFAYCSILPKDYEFEEEELVQLWMAEGFLHGANTKTKIRELGSKYFQELVSRSFFQASSTNKSHFVMHDLINDLAQFVGGEIYFKRERDEEMKLSSHIRHSSYIMGEYDVFKKFETFFHAKSTLRTFLPFDTMKHDSCYLSHDVLTELLSRLKCLRVLSLKRYCITEIPSFIEKLKHLRYLDFSYTKIKGLPNSVCTLYNLETLLLRYCEKIKKLPSRIENLDNLCCLDITGAKSIKEMPSGIGKLTNLQILSTFVVGQGDELNITDMKNLSNLRGRLLITELQNVNEARFAKEAKLSSKSNLDHLELEWSRDFNANLRKHEVEKEVLNFLRPHEVLKSLVIKYYAGISFPTWIEDHSFQTLHSLRFEGCENCALLPAVGKLPLLKDLYIKGMSGVISVGDELYGENWTNAFSPLETLHFEDMPEWKEWKPRKDDEQGKSFQHLRELIIMNCPKLMGSLPGGLRSLEKLVIKGCGELIVSISNLPMLCELEINGCGEVVVGSYDDLWPVKKISLKSIAKFTFCVRKEMMMSKCIMKAEDLWIGDDCDEQASPWQAKWGWLAHLRSLRHVGIINISQEVVCIGAEMINEEEKTELLQLDIPCNIENLTLSYCQGLERLSKTLNNLTYLSQLNIYGCPKLVSLSTYCLPPSLKQLEFRKCDKLQYVFDDDEETNINFRSTNLRLESLNIFFCEAVKSISSSGWLPMGLKSLSIMRCPKLESIAQEIGDNTNCCLQSIIIHGCGNIKYLPQGLDKLNHLQEIKIWFCPNLVCFPESGLPTANFRLVWLWGCEELEALPNNLHSLPQLRHLSIEECPKLKYNDSNLFPLGEGSLLSNLTSLWMEDEPKMSKAVMQCWGLHTFISLTDLKLDGGDCVDVVSFPPMNMKLPSSLIQLQINNFKNVRKLSSYDFRSLTSLQDLYICDCPNLESLPKSFQNLTSLRYLSIWNSPKLKSLPKMEMLLELHVSKCPQLKKWCKRVNNKLGKQKCFSNIAHIPKVEIDRKFIYDYELEDAETLV